MVRPASTKEQLWVECAGTGHGGSRIQWSSMEDRVVGQQREHHDVVPAPSDLHVGAPDSLAEEPASLGHALRCMVVDVCAQLDVGEPKLGERPTRKQVDGACRDAGTARLGASQNPTSPRAAPSRGPSVKRCRAPRRSAQRRSRAAGQCQTAMKPGSSFAVKRFNERGLIVSR